MNSLLFGLGGGGDGSGGGERERQKNARKYVIVDPSLEMGCLDEGKVRGALCPYIRLDRIRALGATLQSTLSPSHDFNACLA